MELKDIFVKNYLFHPNRSEYDALLQYSTASKDIANLGDLINCEFGFVKQLQYSVSKGFNIDGLVEYFPQVNIYELKFSQFVQLINWIKNQLEFINKLESDNLSYQPDGKEEAAGIDDFNKFGYLVQIDSLAGGDITKYEQVKKTKYMDCFTKLLMNKTTFDYTKRLNKLYGKV